MVAVVVVVVVVAAAAADVVAEISGRFKAGLQVVRLLENREPLCKKK